MPTDHVCRVIDSSVEGLAMLELGFERAEAAETGRPDYGPRDLLKLYLYGHVNQAPAGKLPQGQTKLPQGQTGQSPSNERRFV